MFRNRRLFLLVLALVLGSSIPGCAPFRNWCGQRFGSAPVQCALPDDATQVEVVDRLNENTKRILSWRTTKATIKTRGTGIMVPEVGAMIAVETPRNFRLVATHPMTGGNEVDLGSNQEHFWFWNKHSEERYVYQARHDVEPERMRRFPFPFQPDWIMEALGVVEIDPEKPMTMQPGPAGSKHTVLLVADCVSPQGLKVRKVTVVDLCQGVVREQALYDTHGQLIARAVLANYVSDQKSQALIATKIDLEWPQAKLGLTMRLSEIEVNPPRISPQTWTTPNIPDNPIVDMTR